MTGVDVDTQRGAEAMAEAGCEFMRADVGNLGEIDTVVAAVIERHQRIDVLVNNAGVTKALGFFDVTEADWDRINRVNAKGLFFFMQAVARTMRDKRQGRIVNIGSIAGKGYIGASNIAYAGSKGAVTAMTRNAAYQLARYNVNVNAVCPGITRTDLFQQVVGERADKRGTTYDEALERIDASIPLRRSNEPADIADLVVWLASDQARNVTGQSWNVDGGLIWD